MSRSTGAGKSPSSREVIQTCQKRSPENFQPATRGLIYTTLQKKMQINLNPSRMAVKRMIECANEYY